MSLSPSLDDAIPSEDCAIEAGIRVQEKLFERVQELAQVFVVVFHVDPRGQHAHWREGILKSRNFWMR